MAPENRPAVSSPTEAQGMQHLPQGERFLTVASSMTSSVVFSGISPFPLALTAKKAF